MASPILIEQTQQADGWKEPVELHVELSCAFNWPAFALASILDSMRSRSLQVRDDRWRFRQLLQGTE